MGGHFWARAAAWTFFCLVQVLSAERGLFQDLGVQVLPDVTQINISQDEYTRMMSAYLERRQLSSPDINSIPELITFYIVKQETKSNKLRFPIHPNQDMETENAQLRILAPPSASSEVQVRLYQILGARRKRLLEDRTLYLHHNLTKWCEFDVTSAVQSWVSGDRNLGLELIWSDTRDFLHPLEAVVSALVYPHRRSRRSVSPYQPLRRTDCNEASRGGKRRCCRHNLTVKFAELRFLEMGSIIQPKSYDLGYCQGQCPPTYNHATNHSRIQSYIHQQDRKNAKRLNRRAVPKACCAPSKLESLDILRVNPQDNTKLIVEKWDNMQVIECACS